MSSSKTDRFSSGRALYPRASAAALPLGRSGLLTWTGFYGAVDKRAFVLECTSARMRVEELLPPLVIAVRQELRIKINAEDYAALMADARNAQRQVIEKAMSPRA